MRSSALRAGVFLILILACGSQDFHLPADADFEAILLAQSDVPGSFVRREYYVITDPADGVRGAGYDSQLLGRISGAQVTYDEQLIINPESGQTLGEQIISRIEVYVDAPSAEKAFSEEKEFHRNGWEAQLERGVFANYSAEVITLDGDAVGDEVFRFAAVAEEMTDDGRPHVFRATIIRARFGNAIAHVWRSAFNTDVSLADLDRLISMVAQRIEMAGSAD